MVQLKLDLKFENVQNGFYGGQRMEGFMENLVAQLEWWQLALRIICLLGLVLIGPN
jgi:hypothetical protein